MADYLDSQALRVTAYILAGALCLLAGRAYAAAPRDAGRERLWIAAGVALLFLGLCREIDLGPRLTDLGRDNARTLGLYDVRREYQVLGVLAALFAGMVGAGILAALLLVRGRRREFALLLLLDALVVFVVVRAVSLHQVDSVLYHRYLLGARLSSLTELTLLAAIGLFAIFLGARDSDVKSRR